MIACAYPLLNIFLMYFYLSLPNFTQIALSYLKIYITDPNPPYLTTAYYTLLNNYFVLVDMKVTDIYLV